MDLRWKAFLRTAASSRVIFVSLALIFLAYIRISSLRTRNWKDSLELGLGQKGFCNEPNLSYGLFYFEADVGFNSSHFIPICEKRSVGFCVGDSFWLNCFETIDSNPFPENLNEKFQVEERDFAPYTTIMLVCGIFCVFLSYLYENNRIQFIEEQEGRFNSSTDKAMMLRFLNMLCFSLSILMFVSAASLISIHRENCTKSFRPQTTYDTRFCEKLSECEGGVGIYSIVNPDDYFAVHFSSFAVAIGVMILLTTAVNCLFGKSGRYYHTVHPQLDGEEDAEERAPVRARASAPPREVSHQIRFALLDLKTNTRTSISEKDCPICLTSLVPLRRGDEDTEADTPPPDVVTLPCSHCFHLRCMVEWTKDHHSCPVCRRDISH